MIEGKERETLTNQINLMSVLPQIPLMSQMIEMDGNTISQLNHSSQEFVEKTNKQIDDSHKDELTDVKAEDIKQADAFAKIFHSREQLQKGGN